MQKLLKLFSLALFAVQGSACLAQSERVTVTLNDGTSQTFAAQSIDSITFSDSKAEAQAISCSLDKVESVYMQFTTMPTDAVDGYNVMYLEKSEFDDTYKSDKEVVDDDLKYFSELATYYGMTLAEVIDAFLYHGEYTEWICGLKPDTDYVLWYYGLSTDGTLTSPLQKLTFHTPAAVQISNTIDIQSTTEDGNTQVTYTPDTEDVFFTSGFVNKSNGYSDDEIIDIMQQNISESLYDWLTEGEPVTTALQELAYKGGAVTVTPTGMTSGTEYYAVAAYVNDEGAICSPLFKQTVSAATASATNVAAKHKTLNKKSNQASLRGIRGLRVLQRR